MAEISSAPTTFSATATTSASARVRMNCSRFGSMPLACARSAFSVAVSSPDQRQTSSATTSAAPPQITRRSPFVTARMSPSRIAIRSTRMPPVSATTTSPTASPPWAKTPRIVSTG